MFNDYIAPHCDVMHYRLRQEKNSFFTAYSLPRLTLENDKWMWPTRMINEFQPRVWPTSLTHKDNLREWTWYIRYVVTFDDSYRMFHDYICLSVSMYMYICMHVFAIITITKTKLNTKHCLIKQNKSIRKTKSW